MVNKKVGESPILKNPKFLDKVGQGSESFKLYSFELDDITYTMTSSYDGGMDIVSKSKK